MSNNHRKAMALLDYPPESLAPPLAGLLDLELRTVIAARVNEAILRSFGDKDQPMLKSLLRLRAWAERKSREQGKDLPMTLDIWQDNTTTEGDDSIMADNGDHNNGHGEAEAMSL